MPHFVTCTFVGWIDVFSRKSYRDCIIECLDFCTKNKGMILYGYVIMSNHIHMIVQASDGELSNLLRDFKKFTAKTILEKIENEPKSRRECMLERFAKAPESHSRHKNYQFWKYSNHPEEIYTEKFMWSKLDYIHLNPVRAVFLQKHLIIYSSASNYDNDSGLLPIEKVIIPIVNVLNLNNFTKYNKY